jgi:hypothetical protein
MARELCGGVSEAQVAEATQWFAILIGGAILARVANEGPQRDTLLKALLEAAKT